MECVAGVGKNGNSAIMSTSSSMPSHSVSTACAQGVLRQRWNVFCNAGTWGRSS